MDVKLVMFKQDGQRRDFEIKKDTVTIGRNTDCDFQIPLGVISRRQCQITVAGDKVHVRDLGSSNGTFVNNKRVQESELVAGDTLVVGPVIFTIVVDGVPGDVKAVRSIVDPKKRKAESNVPERDDGTVDVEAGVDDVEEVMELEDDEEGHEEEHGGDDNPLAALEALSKKKQP